MFNRELTLGNGLRQLQSAENSVTPIYHETLGRQGIRSVLAEPSLTGIFRRDIIERFTAAAAKNNYDIHDSCNFFFVWYEAMINAVQHGSNFGILGAVLLRAWSSREGLLATVSNPSTRFIEKGKVPLYQLMERMLPETTTGNEIRGQGGSLMYHSALDIGFEKTHRWFHVHILHNSKKTT